MHFSIPFYFTVFLQRQTYSVDMPKISVVETLQTFIIKFVDYDVQSEVQIFLAS